MAAEPIAWKEFTPDMWATFTTSNWDNFLPSLPITAIILEYFDLFVDFPATKRGPHVENS